MAGSKVKKGELIFVIEPDTYQDNVTQAEAALKTSKAQLDYARSNYERMKEAAKSGAVSRYRYCRPNRPHRKWKHPSVIRKPN